MSIRTLQSTFWAFPKYLTLTSALSLGFLAFAEAQVPSGQKLNLNAVLQLALQNNYEIKVEEINPLVAQSAVSASWGEFDPIYFFDYQHEFNQKIQNSLDLSNNGTNNLYFESDNTRYRTGLGIKSPIGTQFQAYTSVDVLDNTRNRQGPGGSFDPTKPRLDNVFSPEYESFAGLQLTQPLLQGLGFGANLKNVREARLNIGISEYGRQVIVLNTLVDVMAAYYDLAFSQTDILVKKDSVAVAETLVKENKRRQSLGLMAPIDVMEAEVKVSEAQEEVIKAEGLLGDRRIRLLQLISTSYSSAEPPFIEVESDFDDEVPVFDFLSLRSAAFVNRPDYLLAQRNVDKEQISVDFLDNKKMPQLDVSLSYGLNGFGSDMGNSYDLLTKGDRPRWAAGVSFKMPIPGRTATHEKIGALRKKNQAELKVRQMELRIPLEIQNALGRINGLQERLVLSNNSIRVAEAAFKLEMARLEQGKTTTRNVLEIQDKLAEARTRKLAAQAEIKKSISEVWATSGLLMQKLGYTFEADKEVRKEFEKVKATAPALPTPPEMLPADMPPVKESSGFFPYIKFGHRSER
ncbi:MAG: TolC family protein [Verrucomicrobiota bacterium]|nr:TolC family protein [Verrucomicrobiota bacterium]